jgi:4-hydroxybenzoate polyprenyltransferase
MTGSAAAIRAAGAAVTLATAAMVAVAVEETAGVAVVSEPRRRNDVARDPKRIRARNAALVQFGLAIGCLLVAALLVYVDTLPGEMRGLPGALVTLGLLAIWMLRRGRRALRHPDEPSA